MLLGSNAGWQGHGSGREGRDRQEWVAKCKCGIQGATTCTVGQECRSNAVVAKDKRVVDAL